MTENDPFALHLFFVCPSLALHLLFVYPGLGLRLKIIENNPLRDLFEYFQLDSFTAAK